MTTYNGDFFDLPFVAKRCEIHDINLYEQASLQPLTGGGGGEAVYVGRFETWNLFFKNKWNLEMIDFIG